MPKKIGKYIDHNCFERVTMAWAIANTHIWPTLFFMIAQFQFFYPISTIIFGITNSSKKIQSIINTKIPNVMAVIDPMIFTVQHMMSPINTEQLL